MSATLFDSFLSDPSRAGAYQISDDELIVDLFAGGGGASEGIFEALGRHPDIAINHDPEAIAVHTRNHPTTKHYCQDIWKVHPLEACGDRPVGLLWMSPSCTHFSRAAGGVPKSKQLRSQPGVGLTWAKYVRPKVIVVENVPEMQDWGPLLDDGTPCPKRVGRSFKTWCGRMRGMGYKVEFRKLCAADVGVPTIRTRLFIIARCDGGKIVWPSATHSRKPSLFEKSWKGAGECIDWNIPCPSIFKRKRPLKEATLRRIAAGVMRFVVKAEDPFIIKFQQNSVGQPTTDPLHTVMAGATRFGLVSPTISSLYGTSRGSSVEHPLGAVTAQGQHHALIAANLMPITHQGERRGSGMDEPMPTLTCANRGEQAIISAFLGGCGGRAAQSPPRPMDAPLGTATSKADQMLVAAFMAQHNGGVVGSRLSQPLSTITSQASQQNLVETMTSEDLEGAQRVAAFLIQYYSNGKQAQPLSEPLGAATTKGRFALVMVHGRPITDIGMRMLHLHELQAAQGFRADYDLSDGGRLSKTTGIRLVGNSVCPGQAAAVVRANVVRAVVPAPLERVAA